jgi:hypothetical protein
MDALKTTCSELSRSQKLHSSIARGAVFLLQHRWQTLHVEADRLCDLARHAVPLFACEATACLANNLNKLLTWGQRLCRCRSQHYSGLRACEEPENRKSLRVACGSPSTTGCVPYNSTAIKWKVFTHKQVGILAAMQSLDLDVLVLPGARLGSDFKPPEEWKIKACCKKGEQSYDSCAVLWRSSLETFVPVPDIGGNRRLHFVIPRCRKGPLIVSGVYLPTDNANHTDEEWVSELQLLSEDLDRLHARFSEGLEEPATVDHLVTGDMNLQPSSLGAGSDRKGARERAWNTFVQKHSLHVLNPPLGDSQPMEVDLPLRQKKVKIRTGDTHHHLAGGASRAIDIACSTIGLNAECTVHNSLHCLSYAKLPRIHSRRSLFEPRRHLRYLRGWCPITSLQDAWLDT